MKRSASCACALLLTATAGVSPTSQGTEWHVAPGSAGIGTPDAPFGSIQEALQAAEPGDSILVGAGLYQESLRSVRNGSASSPVRLRARHDRGSAVVTASGRVLTVSHAHLAIEGLVLDGQYGSDDLVRVADTATGFTLKNVEIRRSGRDGVDMGAVADVLIEDSSIHHTLDSARGRTDAHAVVAGAVRRLTIRNSELHTFSGDGLQVDPGRSPMGWADVTIDGCRIWLAPLPAEANGFPAGTVPGENAVDTKANPTAGRGTLTIRDTVAFGFRAGLIGNMAAFNLKESIDAVIDGVTVHASEIAFRVRGVRANGGARVRVQNAVVFDVQTAFRYEDDPADLRVWNVTVGGGVERPFQRARSGAASVDVRNFLILGSRVPRLVVGPARAVRASAFVDAKAHDYRLAHDSPAIDAGERIPEVERDRNGTSRPQGRAFDLGAFEAVGPGPGRPPADRPAPLRLVSSGR